jgi:hypothetical protein
MGERLHQDKVEVEAELEVSKPVVTRTIFQLAMTCLELENAYLKNRLVAEKLIFSDKNQ